MLRNSAVQYTGRGENFSTVKGDCGQRFFYFSFLKHARKNHQNRFTRHYSSSTSKLCLATSYRHYIFWTRVKVVVRHGMFFITRRLLYYLFLRARGKTGGEELFFFIVRPFVFWHFIDAYAKCNPKKTDLLVWRVLLYVYIIFIGWWLREELT